MKLFKFLNLFELKSLIAKFDYEDERPSLLLRAQHMCLKGEEGLMIENIEAGVFGLTDIDLPILKPEEIKFNDKDIKIAIVSFTASFSDAFITEFTNSAIDYNDSPISGLNINFYENKIEIRGKVHKGITVPFAMDLDFEVLSDNIIKITIERLWAIELIPLPQMLQSFILNHIHETLNKHGIKVVDNTIIFDIKSFLPPNISVNLNKIIKKKSWLIFQG